MRTGRAGKSRIILNNYVQAFQRFITKSPFGDFVKRLNLQPFLGQAAIELPPEPVFDPKRFNCRVEVQKPGAKTFFNIKICGRVTVDAPGQHIKLHIRFFDITKGIKTSMPVYKNIHQNISQKQQSFEHICELGKVPELSIEMPDWLSIAQINTKMLFMPHQESSIILMQADLFCPESERILDTVQFWFRYDNTDPGYLDIQKNIEQAKITGVTLAFAVCAADRKLYKSEIEYIRNWACTNIYDPSESRKKRRKILRALNMTAKFFRKGMKVDVLRLCMEINQKAPLAYRFPIIEMCICAVATKGIISDTQIKMLKDIALRLEIDMQKFHIMFERLASLCIRKVKDMESLFGLNSQMSHDQSLEKLKQEYRKWNARVTSSDTTIQKQAEQMLELIAQARSQYTS